MLFASAYNSVTQLCNCELQQLNACPNNKSKRVMAASDATFTLDRCSLLQRLFLGTKNRFFEYLQKSTFGPS